MRGEDDRGEEYIGDLVLCRSWSLFRLVSLFAGIIRDVPPTGELVIELDDSHTETFFFKEVQYVL